MLSAPRALRFTFVAPPETPMITVRGRGLDLVTGEEVDIEERVPKHARESTLSFTELVSIEY